MRYNCHYSFASMGLMIIIYIYHKLQYSNASVLNKAYRKLVVVSFLETFLDTFTAYTISYYKLMPLWINSVFNSLMYLVLAYLAVVYADYFIIRINGTISKWRHIALYGIMVLYDLAVVCNHWFGYFFTVSAEEGYVHSAYFIVLLVVPYLVVGWAIGLFIINIKKFTKFQVGFTLFYLIVLAGILVIQTFFVPSVLLIGLGLLILVLIVLFTLETPDYEKLQITLKELEVARLEADRANAAKSSFIANMSHEIRTPINAVIGMDEMILRDSDSDIIKEYAENIKSASNTLLNIINTILDFSKIESGKTEIVEKEYLFTDLIKDVELLIRVKADEKRLGFDIELDESIPNQLFGDNFRIKQVLINLLGNAVKYTKEGQVKLKIGKSEAALDEVWLLLEISDTGIGIKQEDMPHLFDKFQRLDQTKTSGIEGTGLGLSIAKNLVLLMGGTIDVTSVYGEGTTFIIKLKQKALSNETIQEFRLKDNAKNENEEEVNEKLDIPDTKILVVDDNEINLFVFECLLKESRAQVTKASSGMECLEKLRNEQYDMVFLDHMMPELDGIETLHKLKEENVLGGAIVVALTANAISGVEEMYKKEGFDEYLSKPIEPPVLEAMIRKYVKRRAK